MPRVSADLEARPAGGRSGARGPGHVLDGALDARDRVNTALGAVGPEMSGMIVDVCCHMKSLAAVERERGWPKRSAKVVLDLGLARLARHYGLCEEARGRARPRGVRHWGAPGYRPDLE